MGATYTFVGFGWHLSLPHLRPKNLDEVRIDPVDVNVRTLETRTHAKLLSDGGSTRDCFCFTAVCQCFSTNLHTWLIGRPTIRTQAAMIAIPINSNTHGGTPMTANGR